jgi:hypothetical protein
MTAVCTPIHHISRIYISIRITGVKLEKIRNKTNYDILNLRGTSMKNFINCAAFLFGVYKLLRASA